MASSKKRVLFRYLAYAKPYRWLIGLVIVSGIAKFTIPLIPAYIVRVIVDEVIGNAAGLSVAVRQGMLWWLGGALLGVVAVEAAVMYLRGVSTVKVATSVVFDVRQALWRHLQRLSLGFHASRPTGSILSRLMSDISASQQMIHGGIANVCIDAVSGTVGLVVLLSISWKLTLLVLGVLPLYAVLYRKINPRIRQASHEVREQTSVMSGTAVERLNGIAVVQSFAQEPAEERNFAAQAEELRGRSVRRGRLSHMLKAASEFMITGVGASVWVVGGFLAMNEGITVGQLIQFTAVAAVLYRPIRRFSEINIVYQNSMAAIERVFAIFDIVPEVRGRPDVPDRAPQAGEIIFDDVSFAYGDGPEVLSEVSFSVRPGERMAIVGESGAGKSTLVTLIPRLYDVTGGAIRIDGTDVRDYPLRRLRREIGIVLQDTILFSGTVRENLRYGWKKAGEAEIVEAAQAANAHEFITELPDGYDTVIGERGLTLSGGQRQRISLARTILQNPRILILDEATSSLDSESENLIAEALERAQVGRTCLIIAHRLSTVVGADRVLVFRRGRLVEDGTHADLLGAGGYYGYLFDQQFGPLQELMAQGRWGND